MNLRKYEKFFSEKKRKVYLDEIDNESGRAGAVLGGIAGGLATEHTLGTGGDSGYAKSALFHGISSAAGGYLGKKAAEKADRDGKTDGEIKNIALTSGALAGGTLGGLTGLAISAASNKKFNPANTSRMISTAGLGATFGGITSGASAYRNARKKIKKRKELEEKSDNKKDWV